MGRRQRGLSLRMKRGERVGVWWLDGAEVSVMAWCQTLCHCQCQPRQPIPQWSATVQCVSKPLCCCHFNQCVAAAVLSHFSPLSIPQFSLVIGFEDDVIAEQLSHPQQCVICHTMCLHFLHSMNRTDLIAL